MNSVEQYFLSGDSGGTKTNWQLLSGSAGAVNCFELPGMASLHPGMLPCRETAARAAARIPASQTPKIVYLSLGGPNTEEVREALKAAFPKAKIVVEREADGTLLAEVSELLKIQGAVLAGTGVTAVGFHASNRRRYAEGWGPVFGDAGSGGGIGMAAMRRILKEVDRLEKTSRLPVLLQPHFEGLDLSTFAGRMAFKARINELSRSEIAALAPGVMNLAMAGDAAAQKIIADTADEIGALAAAVLPPSGTILWLGGLFRLGAPFRRACDEALARRRPDCRSWFDERLSLGNIAALRTLVLSGVTIKEPLLQEILYGRS